jgi:hypothetical protein
VVENRLQPTPRDQRIRQVNPSVRSSRSNVSVATIMRVPRL